MAETHAGVKKRNRVALSCTECRTRKLKCDRKQPCNNCTSRDLVCVFAAGPGKTSSNSKPHNEDLRSKLQRLEQLVSQMADNQHPNGARMQQATPESNDDSSSSPTPEFETRPGHLITNVTGQHYVGPSNWETILHDIADIRDHLEDIPGVLPEPPASFSSHRNPAILSGVSGEKTFNELLLELPSRMLADRLMERFFSVYDPAVPSRQMLHKPSFLRAYENFWNTKEMGFCPSALGSYYAVFCLALQSYYRQDDEPSDLQGHTMDLADTYRRRAAQCALKSDLTAPTRPSIECLLLSTMCEYSHLNESTAGIYLVMGVIVRKALVMGLHRDPDKFTTLSPFEKEMRRRLWAHIRQFDLMFSFHLGVPNAVHISKTDVGPPCNVYEEELTETMNALPRARPADEPTPINFTITKGWLIDSLERIVEHLHHVQGHTYEQLEDLHQKLQTSMERIPQYLRVQPVEESLSVPKSLRLQRLQIELFCDKAICMLNRRFISGAETRESTSPTPRARCIESALRILYIQERLELEQTRWWLYYLVKHDFLLAATILYLVLFTKCKESELAQGQMNGGIPHQLDEEDMRIRNALEASWARWSRIADESPCARRACRIFTSMEQQLKVSKPNGHNFQPLANFTAPVPGPPTFSELKLDDITTTMATGDLDPLAAVDASFSQFDWDAWDSSMKMAETYYDSHWLT